MSYYEALRVNLYIHQIFTQICVLVLYENSIDSHQQHWPIV